MVELINLREKEKELSELEIKRMKSNYRFQQISSLVVMIIAVPAYAICRKQMILVRGTADLYGGEVMLLLLALVLALMIYPKYSLKSLLPTDKKISRHSDNHVDIDIYSKDSSIDSINEGYNFEVVSKSGVYDIIDHDRNHHMISLTKRG